MVPEVAKVVESARGLSREQRADVAYQLLLTLDEGADSGETPDVEAAWRTELGLRVDDYLAGNRPVIDVEESHAQIRATHR